MKPVVLNTSDVYEFHGKALRNREDHLELQLLAAAAEDERLERLERLVIPAIMSDAPVARDVTRKVPEGEPK